jgi:hypothetical protein
MFAKVFSQHALYALSSLVGYFPTFLARQIVFGNPFAVGPYDPRMWNWTSPVFGLVLFSKDHGLFVFAPIVILAIGGLFYLRRLNRAFGTICIVAVFVFYGLIACFPWWYGAVGLGNRFFVSLTPIFVLGLASLLSWAVRLWADEGAASLRLIPILLVFIVWNLGLVYQWQTHLIPRYGAVYWSELVFNQFRVVPGQAVHDLGERFLLRSASGN